MADVSLYVVVVGRVVPDDVSFSVFLCSCGCRVVIAVVVVVTVCQRLIVSAGPQGVFVDRLGFVEFSFVAGNVRDSTVDGGRELFDYVGWMI